MEILKFILKVTSGGEYQTEAKHVYREIKQLEYKLLAFLALYYGESIFSMSGKPTTLGGPIQKDYIGEYIFLDAIYYKEHGKMASTTGLGYENGFYYVYIFNYPETGVEEEFNKTYKDLKKQGLDAHWKKDEGPEAQPEDKVIIIEFNNFVELAEFAYENLESKLS